ncbi:hypothetical protein E3Q17_01013 [Wallemia mellicola]|uniref:Uncharacterized protein n=1 Tax=Wallemia mellicola TaxID=1708541 RepID=A0A4T0P080_9BASI|nr:hypothetical protein E3Q21_00683 [Wallemia mellicola]TIB91674.1 hypothetical protein E3Q20_00669 [Wallemia mellicola]TIC03304.1 hypothetical protein E3Q17_01013 [Wallemia mellicola]TIC03854.1 hypothetical protein E3Q16_02959 [Wallemia mellicola]TIC44015.1 hypothetical protein E3Q07_00220 [Wallemia mellicola]
MNTQLQHKWQLVRNQRGFTYLDNFSNGGDPEDDVSLLTPFPYRYIYKAQLSGLISELKPVGRNPSTIL